MSECGQRANFNSFNQNFDLRASAFAQRPVDGNAFAYAGNKFCRDHFEVVVGRNFSKTFSYWEAASSPRRHQITTAIAGEECHSDNCATGHSRFGFVAMKVDPSVFASILADVVALVT